MKEGFRKNHSAQVHENWGEVNVFGKFLKSKGGENLCDLKNLRQKVWNLKGMVLSVEKCVVIDIIKISVSILKSIEICRCSKISIFINIQKC